MITIQDTNVTIMTRDMDAAIAFYTRHLGFVVQMHPNPHFAVLDRDGLRLMFSTPTGPGGGSQPAKDGTTPQPGGWNRVQFQVKDLAREVDELRKNGVPFRIDTVTGVGAKLILLSDPSGNLVELYELLPRQD